MPPPPPLPGESAPIVERPKTELEQVQMKTNQVVDEVRDRINNNYIALTRTCNTILYENH